MTKTQQIAHDLDINTSYTVEAIRTLLIGTLGLEEGELTSRKVQCEVCQSLEFVTEKNPNPRPAYFIDTKKLIQSMFTI